MRFFSALLRNPREIGAVVPSSKYLARSLANFIRVDDSVLELGPGTGAITKIILQKIPIENFTALELSADFAISLREKFLGVNVITGDAAELPTLLNGKKIDMIISSLPLLTLPADVRDKILACIPNVLSPGGQFIQYTYSLRKKNIFYPKNFVVKKTFIVWRNIPPARVTVFQINPG